MAVPSVFADVFHPERGFLFTGHSLRDDVRVLLRAAQPNPLLSAPARRRLASCRLPERPLSARPGGVAPARPGVLPEHRGV